MNTIVNEIKNLFLNNTNNNLTSKIQNDFGYEGEILLENITKNCPQNFYYNDTDWNYSTCFSFNFMLEEGVPYPHISHMGVVNLLKKLKHPIYKVCFDISAIMKFYRYIFISIELIENDKKIKYIKTMKPFKENYMKTVNLIEKILNQNNFYKIDENILSLKIPKIKLDYSKKGEVSVYNCLFHDSYGGFSELENENVFIEDVVRINKFE